MRSLDKLTPFDRKLTPLFLPQGNISLFLLKEGLAKCVDWSMKLLPETETYRAAVKSAKVAKKRLWKNWEGARSSHTSHKLTTDSVSLSLNDEPLSITPNYYLTFI